MKVSNVLTVIGLPSGMAGGMMKRSLAVCLMGLAMLACKEPQEEPKSWIEFKYNARDYRIVSDENCFFTQRGDSYTVISGFDSEKKQAFTISVNKKAEINVPLDIYAASLYGSPSIQILFTEGDSLAEEIFYAEDFEESGVIGKLTFTEMSSERMSGTFACRTTNGEITDGKFTVGARVYEQ